MRIRAGALWLCALFLAGCATTTGPAARPSIEFGVVRAIDQSGPEVEIAAYVRLQGGSESDRLIGGGCACAARLEIHNTSPEGMHVLPSVDVPAGSIVDIRPGGAMHLMLIGVKAPIAEGETVNFSLEFEKAGRVNASATAATDTRDAWQDMVEPD